jgi:hypothetical protein
MFSFVILFLLLLAVPGIALGNILLYAACSFFFFFLAPRVGKQWTYAHSNSK